MCPAGPGRLMCPWAAARPRVVRAASLKARRVVSKPGQAPPPPTSTAARPTSPYGALHTSGAWSLIGASTRCPARPRHRPRAPQPGPTTNFACNSLATLSNHEVTTLELQRFRAVLNLRPVELPAELVEPIPSTTHTPSKDVVGFTKVPQSPGTSTSSFTTRRVE